ncbi:hypothetical protein [Natrinema caseinilyticum]|uniref:hypothetical protein n=1 Tax=Natrinema caseinilyticum TaxID=2961570 RepID=UPI0020C2467B|nr:hypothetical protein [Natrinema caseinilyticum]
MKGVEGRGVAEKRGVSSGHVRRPPFDRVGEDDVQTRVPPTAVRRAKPTDRVVRATTVTDETAVVFVGLAG